MYLYIYMCVCVCGYIYVAYTTPDDTSITRQVMNLLYIDVCMYIYMCVYI